MVNIQKTTIKSFHGSVLAFALIIMFIMLSSILTIGAISTIDRKSSLASDNSTQAFQVTDSGVELMINAIKGKSGTIASSLSGLGGICSNGTYTGSAGGGTYQITFYDVAGTTPLDCGADLSQLDHIKSIGTYKNTTRALSIQVPCSSPLNPDGNTVALWHFEDNINSTTAKDSSLNHNDGTFLPVGGTTQLAGVCNARSLNGTTDYIRFSLTDKFNVSVGGDFSGEAWIKTGTDGKIIYHSQQGNPLIYMEVGATTAGGTKDNFVVYLRDSGVTPGVFSGTKRIDDGYWHFVAFTAKTGAMGGGGGGMRTINLYVDGALDTTNTWLSTGAITLTGATGYIGGVTAGGNSYRFNGAIDELQISSTAKDATTIKSEYNATCKRMNPLADASVSPCPLP